MSNYYIQFILIEEQVVQGEEDSIYCLLRKDKFELLIIQGCTIFEEDDMY